MNLTLDNRNFMNIKSSILAVFFALFLMVPSVGTSADDHNHDAGATSTLQPADNWAPRMTVDQLQGKIFYLLEQSYQIQLIN